MRQIDSHTHLYVRLSQKGTCSICNKTGWVYLRQRSSHLVRRKMLGEEEDGVGDKNTEDQPVRRVLRNNFAVHLSVRVYIIQTFVWSWCDQAWRKTLRYSPRCHQVSHWPHSEDAPNRVFLTRFRTINSIYNLFVQYLEDPRRFARSKKYGRWICLNFAISNIPNLKQIRFL